MPSQLFPYYGGKQRLATKIAPLLPPHTVYVEPFCGGASVLFAKGVPVHGSNNHYREVINDTHGLVVNAYRIARHPEQGPELLRRLELTPYARDDYKLATELQHTGDAVDKAWAWIVNCSWSFSNQPITGDGSHTRLSTGVMSSNHAATWANKRDIFPEVFNRLRGVYVENDDAIKVIERWDSPQTCFYVDPPYPGACQGHYAGYTPDNFQALIDALSVASGSFALSCYPNDAVPDDWPRCDFQSHCSASGQGQVGKGRDKTKAATNLGDRKRTECLWVVDRSASIRKDLLGPIARQGQGRLF